MLIHILSSVDKLHYFRIVAKNGRILAHSETYDKLTSCLKTVKSIAKQFRIKPKIKFLL